jgi:hypothetical protein
VGRADGGEVAAIDGDDSGRVESAGVSLQLGERVDAVLEEARLLSGRSPS